MVRSAIVACALTGIVIRTVLAADAVWKSKPAEQWNQDEAKQVLSESPRAKSTPLQWLRDLSVAERRDGGNWEATEGKGVGLAGIGLFGPTRQADAIARAHAKPDPGKVVIRWESARPIRLAEEKSGEADTPVVKSDFYAIAVYDVLTRMDGI